MLPPLLHRLLLLIALAITNQAISQKKIPVKIVAFGNSTCMLDLDERERLERIADVRQEGMRLTFVIDINGNCGARFIPTASIINNELWLDWTDEGEPKECDCCFELDYTVDLPDPGIVVKYKGKVLPRTSERFVTYPIKFEIKDGDTVNYVDKYHRKQGRHYYDNGVLVIDYVDSRPIRKMTYYHGGKLKSLSTSEIDRFLDDFHLKNDSIFFLTLNHSIDYFETGEKKSECYNKDWKAYSFEGHCKEWNEKGDLIYEGTGPQKN